MLNLLNTLKKFLNILEKSKKNKYYFFTFSNLFITFLEIISIGLIIPLISLIVDPNFLINVNKLNIPIISDLTFNKFLILVLIIMTVIFLIKNILVGTLTWKQISYSFDLQTKISSDLFFKYLNKDYLYHTKSDSSKLIRLVNYDAYIVITGFILPSLFFFTELFIILGLVMMLAIFQIYAFLFALIFVFISYVIYRHFSKSLKFHGDRRQGLDTLKIKFVKTAFEGIKEIIFYKKQKLFFDYYKDTVKKNNYSASILQVVQALPRLTLEFFGILFFSITIIILAYLGKNLITTLPLFAVYAVAGFKILPSLNRLISSAHSMKFNKIFIDTVINELNEKNETKNKNENLKTKKVSFNNFIKISHLDFRYNQNQKKYIFKNLSLEIKKNKITAIVGKSGTGKSTLVDILIGLLKPEKCEVTADNNKIDNIEELNATIGYVPQKTFLLDDTIIANILMTKDSMKKINKTNLKNALISSNLINDFKESKISLRTSVGENSLRISGGQAQRVSIARALYNDPDIIIFDEATSSLDKDNELQIFKTLKRLKICKTIIIVTHKEDNLKYCDEVINLDLINK